MVHCGLGDSMPVSSPINFSPTLIGTSDCISCPCLLHHVLHFSHNDICSLDSKNMYIYVVCLAMS
jgi:hypothetical protein